MKAKLIHQRHTPAVSHAFEEHTGEVRLRIEAPTLVELFAEAGRALALLEHGNGPLPEPEGEAQPVSIRSHDRAALLVDWLNELIFRTEVEGKILSDFRFARLTTLRPSLRRPTSVSTMASGHAELEGEAVTGDRAAGLSSFGDVRLRRDRGESVT